MTKRPLDDEQLRARLAALPRSLEPERDLWPELEAKLDEPVGAAGTTAPAGPSLQPTDAPDTAPPVLRLEPRRPRWTWIAGGAMAAAAALAVALITLSPAPENPAGDTPSANMALPAGDGYALVHPALAIECQGVGRDLMASFTSYGTTLDPKVQEQINRDLAALDLAIAETREALEKDPGNRRLQTRLTARYEQKLNLMGRLTRLARIV